MKNLRPVSVSKEQSRKPFASIMLMGRAPGTGESSFMISARPLSVDAHMSWSLDLSFAAASEKF